MVEVDLDMDNLVQIVGSKMEDLVVEKTPDFVQVQEHLLKEMLYYLMVVQVKSMVMLVLKHLLTKMVVEEVQVLVLVQGEDEDGDEDEGGNEHWIVAR